MSKITLSRSDRSALPDNVVKPDFDLARVRPGIVHIGLGGFHRAHMARYTHDLMQVDDGALAWGIVGAGLRDKDMALLQAMAAQDGLYTLVEREGTTETCALIGSIVATIDASGTSAPLLAAIDRPEIRIVSITVTENGYHLDRSTKQLDLSSPAIRADLDDPQHPRTVPGILVEAYARRRAAGAAGFTALTCDNIQHNGDILEAAILSFATQREPALADWIAANASFPNTMVDRITPVPTDEQIAELSDKTGLDDKAAVFAELFRQWVVEDRFVAGRPAWERVGVEFVADVTPYEKMKLRLLNGSHLAIAAVGQLLGYASIGETVNDPLVHRYMAALMDKETGPTLTPIPGVDFATYKAALFARFANPAIEDTTQRVNTDAPVNVLLDPVRDRLAADQSVELLALGLAAWCRRLTGEDDAGATIEVVHPLAVQLRAAALAGGHDPAPVLAIEAIFGKLGGDQRLVSAVGRWLESIYDRGMRATLADAAEHGVF